MYQLIVNIRIHKTDLKFSEFVVGVNEEEVTFEEMITRFYDKRERDKKSQQETTMGPRKNSKREVLSTIDELQTSQDWTAWCCAHDESVWGVFAIRPVDQCCELKFFSEHLEALMTQKLHNQKQDMEPLHAFGTLNFDITSLVILVSLRSHKIFEKGWDNKISEVASSLEEYIGMTV